MRPPIRKAFNWRLREIAKGNSLGRFWSLVSQISCYFAAYFEVLCLGKVKVCPSSWVQLGTTQNSEVKYKMYPKELILVIR